MCKSEGGDLMKPIDFRNATWAEVQGRVQGQRLAVLEGYKAHGPCSTMTLSYGLELSILSVRPRTTELVQLGLVELDKGASKGKGEGVYQAVPEHVALERFLKRKRECRADEQQVLF